MADWDPCTKCNGREFEAVPYVKKYFFGLITKTRRGKKCLACGKVDIRWAGDSEELACGCMYYYLEGINNDRVMSDHERECLAV